MTSNRPYILRALNEWLLDNDETPHLIVSSLNNEQVLPLQFIENDQIILNISPSAVMNLHMENDWISFNARFAGQPMDVLIAVTSVLGIYARESGQGMFFSPEDGVSEEGDAVVEKVDESNEKPKKPFLKIVK